jgi:predicted nucleotidyltransferase
MTTSKTSLIPPINQRLRIPQQAINDVVNQIVEGYQPLKIILFGSYAYGQPGPDSDVGLLVVLDTSLKETEQAIRICQKIDYHFGLDLIVRTPAILAQRLAWGDPFINEIINKGKILYERADH